MRVAGVVDAIAVRGRRLGNAQLTNYCLGHALQLIRHLRFGVTVFRTHHYPVGASVEEVLHQLAVGSLPVHP